MYNLANAQDVTVEISGQTVLRVPVIISMASGNPERGRETFVGTPDEVASSGYVNPYNDSNVTANSKTLMWLKHFFPCSPPRTARRRLLTIILTTENPARPMCTP